jgi:hypothetical protein
MHGRLQAVEPNEELGQEREGEESRKEGDEEGRGEVTLNYLIEVYRINRRLLQVTAVVVAVLFWRWAS